jgi:hypothetical protein
MGCIGTRVKRGRKEELLQEYGLEFRKESYGTHSQDGRIILKSTVKKEKTWIGQKEDHSVANI